MVSENHLSNRTWKEDFRWRRDINWKFILNNKDLDIAIVNENDVDIGKWELAKVINKLNAKKACRENEITNKIITFT